MELIAGDKAFISVGRYIKPLDESVLGFVKNILAATE